MKALWLFIGAIMAAIIASQTGQPAQNWVKIFSILLLGTIIIGFLIKAKQRE